jgi:hypothetical protein
MPVRFIPSKDDFIQIITGFPTVKRFTTLERKDIIRYTILSSQSGHYRISRHGIERMTVKDGREQEPFVAKFGTVELLCDDSKIEYSKHDITYLPSDSTIRTMTNHIYRLSPEVNVDLVVVEDESGLVIDAWFEMEPGLWTNPAVCQAIDSFFSSR